MATELYKEEDSQVYNIGVRKLLLNSLILSCIGICPDSIKLKVLSSLAWLGMERYPCMDGSEAMVLFIDSSFP